jgi:uncharacterized membrane protein
MNKIETENRFTDLISLTKESKNEIIKIRVLHQIEAEKALLQKVKPKFDLDANSILTAMFIVLASLTLVQYSISGKYFYKNSVFFSAVLIISSVMSILFFLIAYIHYKKQTPKENEAKL